MNPHTFDISDYVQNISANRSLKDALMTRLLEQRVPQHISVTDLLNMKIAYFRRKYPEIVPSLERKQLMWTGTGFHDIFGSLVSSEEYIEQFVEVEGVVGRIDIFETVPIEVKTTTNLSEDADLRLKRPSYLEQLGIYCSMVDIDEGKVVIYQRDIPLELSAPLIVFSIKFSNLQAIYQEMIRRRDLLQQAITSGDPSRLPKCPWQNIRCEYSEVCDCATSGINTSYEIVDMVTNITPDEKTVQKLLSKLTVQAPSELLRMNDIVFPRKAYWARVQREKLKDEENIVSPDFQESLVSIERQGLLRTLGYILRYSAKGDVKRSLINTAGIKDTILFYQGKPTIIRATGLRSIVDRERLPQMCSHYFLRLGFECAIGKNEKGRLVLYYRNIRQEDAKLLIYDVTFRDLDILKVEAERRADLVVSATSCEELPECPSWMCRYCKYAQLCQN